MKSIFSIGCVLAAGLAASVVTTLPTLSAQGQWKPLFNGKDFTGLTTPPGGGRRGAPAPTTPPSTNPAERGWKIENGVITSAPPPEGSRTGGLATADKFRDFELEFDFMLAESGTKCTPKLGDHTNPTTGQVQKQANLSEERPCAFNSGVTFRNGYQLNLGRREAGEYIGVVVHREIPEAIRTNVAWLSTGDCGAKNNVYLQDCEQFPMLRKKGDWNHIRLSFKGTHLQAWLNNKQIVDVKDDPTNPAEATWKEAGPIAFQYPPAGESGGFAGTVKFKNLRVREL